MRFPPLPIIIILSCDTGGAVKSDAVEIAPDTTPAPETTAPETTPDASPVVPSLQLPGVGWPVDLTSDGAAALLMDSSVPTNDIYVFDVAGGELEKVTSTGDFERPVFGIAGEGDDIRIVGFHGDPIEAAYWTREGGWRELGTTFEQGCDLSVSGAFDISADGGAIVGLDWNGCDAAAFLWTETDGMAPLDRLGKQSRASVIADDGMLIGGFAMTAAADRSPAIWHRDGTGTLLDPTEEVIGEVLSVSADGGRVAGLWYLDAFTWTEAGGVVIIGRLPTAMPTEPTYANAIADGGRLIFGGSGDAWAGTIRAFVWTEADGLRPLQEIAVAAGVELPEGYVLSNVFAASDDGTVLLGSALELAADKPFPVSHPFVLTLPISAYGL